MWDEHKYMETNNGQCYSYAQIQYIEELAGFYIVNCEGKICWELGQDKYNIEVIRKHIWKSRIIRGLAYETNRQTISMLHLLWLQ